MSLPPRIVWAYTYRLTPPQSASRLRKVKAMLAEEQREAGLRDGMWEGRMVVDDRVAQILVLSDSPDIDLDVNRRLEAALRAIDAGFAVTVPFPISGDGAHPADDGTDGIIVGGPATADPSDPPATNGDAPVVDSVGPPVAIRTRKPRVPRKQ